MFLVKPAFSARKNDQSNFESKSSIFKGAFSQPAAAPSATPYQVISNRVSPSSSQFVFITPRALTACPSRTKLRMFAVANSLFGKIKLKFQTDGQTNCSSPAF